jgi:hypothetical protein
MRSQISNDLDLTRRSLPFARRFASPDPPGPRLFRDGSPAGLFSPQAWGRRNIFNSMCQNPAIFLSEPVLTTASAGSKSYPFLCAKICRLKTQQIFCLSREYSTTYTLGSHANPHFSPAPKSGFYPIFCPKLCQNSGNYREKFLSLLQCQNPDLLSLPLIHSNFPVSKPTLTFQAYKRQI